VALPEADPVKVTEQVPPDTLHEFGFREPAPLDENVTVPVGIIPDPMSVSVTVAVHVEATLTRTGLVHETVVKVERLLIVTLLPLVVWLAPWSRSVGV